MPFDFSIAQSAESLRRLLRQTNVSHAVLMEVCGTHTMAIAKSGVKSLLPDGVSLLSGPGCPVCVTSDAALQAAMHLCLEKDVILAVYGDMLRVPAAGETLLKQRARGADVRAVYSAADAVDLALEHPDRQVVFFAVGFETTAAGTAAALLSVDAENLSNFSMLCALKRVEPALRVLIAQEDFRCDGLLLPGHVATIIGQEGFRFLESLGVPGVIAGFETGDILCALVQLLRLIDNQTPLVQNEYTRAVRREGNPAAQQMIARAFVPCADVWRGLGLLPEGGFALRPAFSRFDAWRRFSLDRLKQDDAPAACRCADVISARIRPQDCPFFGRACTPANPCGPCMVSSEGSCAAAHRYRGADALRL